MKKGFIKGEKVLELLLDNKAKLILYLDIEKEKYYFDSALYFYDGKKEILLVNDSFAFLVGKGLYIRSHCINDYNGTNFDKELEGLASSDYYDKIDKKFELSECVGYKTYLIKSNGKAKFFLYKFRTVKTKKILQFPYEKLYEAEVPESNITQWQEILGKEFIPRYIAELKKINTDTTDEQIEAFLIALRNGGF